MAPLSRETNGRENNTHVQPPCLAGNCDRDHGVISWKNLSNNLSLVLRSGFSCDDVDLSPLNRSSHEIFIRRQYHKIVFALDRDLARKCLSRSSIAYKHPVFFGCVISSDLIKGSSHFLLDKYSSGTSLPALILESAAEKLVPRPHIHRSGPIPGTAYGRR